MSNLFKKELGWVGPFIFLVWTAEFFLEFSREGSGQIHGICEGGPHPTDETDRTEDPKPESTWAEFNKGVKRKAGAFASFEFTRDDVIIVKQAMMPGLCLLHRSLHLASAQWSDEQELANACGNGRLYRAVECAQNKFEDMCFSEVKQQMEALPLALPLSSYNRRCRSMFFRLQATLLCRLEFTVRHQHRGSRGSSIFAGQPMLNGVIVVVLLLKLLQLLVTVVLSLLLFFLSFLLLLLFLFFFALVLVLAVVVIVIAVVFFLVLVSSWCGGGRVEFGTVLQCTVK